MSKKHLVVVALSAAMVGFFNWLPQPVADPTLTPTQTLISQAEIFDGEQWLKPTDVIFEQGYIIELGSNLSQKYPQAKVIDAKGQYLIPGLIDAHTHAWDNALQQAVRFGVTTELDMFTNNAFATPQRTLRSQHQSDLQQADLFSAGTLVTAPNGHGTEYGFKIPTINHAAEADEFIAARIAEGSDYIKIVYDHSEQHRPSINQATLKAVIRAAHQQGKLAVVHISDHQSALIAIEANADGLVHGFIDSANLDSLAAHMSANDQFIIPTLSILASMTGQQTMTEVMNDFSSQPHLKVEQLRGSLTKVRGRSNYHQAFQQAQANIKKLAAAGVMILAGTDAPNPGTAHGISLHGELALLVKLGLTPTDALKAATSNVVKAFKIKDRGLIKPLMKADLILLKQDPRLNISHTRSIDAIYKNGFVIKKSAATLEQEQLTKLKPTIMLGDFEHDLVSALTTQWQTTTDQRFGGNSTVNITRTNDVEQNNNQVMTIDGMVGTKFSYPWSGAWLSFSPDQKAAFDLSNITSLTLRAKGSVGQYKLMVFSNLRPMRPLELSFKVTEQWQDITLALTSLEPHLLRSVTGIAIVASPPLVQFSLTLDDLWLN